MKKVSRTINLSENSSKVIKWLGEQVVSSNHGSALVEKQVSANLPNPDIYKNLQHEVVGSPKRILVCNPGGNMGSQRSQRKTEAYSLIPSIWSSLGFSMKLVFFVWLAKWTYETGVWGNTEETSRLMSNITSQADVIATNISGYRRVATEDIDSRKLKRE